MAAPLTDMWLGMFKLRVSPGSPLTWKAHGHSHCGLQLGEQRSGTPACCSEPLELSEGCVPIHEGNAMCVEEVAQQGRSEAPWGDLPGKEHISTALLDGLCFHRCVLVGVGWGRGQISALHGKSFLQVKDRPGCKLEG